MTILATYESPLGNPVELHHDGGRFWTELAGIGKRAAVYIERSDARWHYVYAAQNGGTLFAHWPGGDEDDEFDVDVLLFGTKRCNVCGLDLPANSEHYHRDRSRPDGLKSTCKQCECMRERAGYERRRERQGRLRARKPAAEPHVTALSPRGAYRYRIAEAGTPPEQKAP